jgi:hypothetical protein
MPEEEDEECIKSQFSRGPPTSSETRDPSVRLSIIYPLPSAENLLGHEPTPPATTIDSVAVAPPVCVPALTPPPTHYKRRRGRIISDADYDPDPDQASIRYVCVLSFLAAGHVVTTPRIQIKFRTRTREYTTTAIPILNLSLFIITRQ